MGHRDGRQAEDRQVLEGQAGDEPPPILASASPSG